MGPPLGPAHTTNTKKLQLGLLGLVAPGSPGVDLVGSHTNYLVPQRTADDTTNEAGGLRASQGNLTRNTGSKHEAVLALDAWHCKLCV